MLLNIGKDARRVAVRIAGTPAAAFEAHRTTDDKDRYAAAGQFTVQGGVLHYEAPGRSATTFFALSQEATAR